MPVRAESLSSDVRAIITTQLDFQQSDESPLPTPNLDPNLLPSGACEDLAELKNLVRYTVLPARHRLKLSDADWNAHFDDLTQTALTTYFEFSHQTPDYIIGIIRHRLTDYALVNIYGRQAGFNSRYARGYFQESLENHTGSMGSYLLTLNTLLAFSRPVEDAVIRQEAKPGQERFWQKVEREFMAILVATGGSKSKPDRLLRYTQALVKRLQGKTNSVIALEMGVSDTEVSGFLERARQRLTSFQSLSPLMQGLLQAQGRLMVYWSDEITPRVLNRGHKFAAILPHGAFNISYHQQRCYAQAGLQVKGKVCTRQVTIGELGSLTYPQLHHGTLELNGKLCALDATHHRVENGLYSSDEES